MSKLSKEFPVTNHLNFSEIQKVVPLAKLG